MRGDLPVTGTTSAAPTFDYSVFGLHVRSEVELPELLEAAGSSEPSVTISIGKAPQPTMAGDGPQLIGGGLLLTIPGVARYFVEDGSRIIVEPEPGVPEANLRLFLLGSAMGALLHQRGLLPLHANAVELGGRAFAFMGPSGCGKSTLAAWFHDQGHRIIADDVCVVGFDEAERPQVRPGISRLRLWRDTLDACGRDAAAYQRSFSGDDAPDKYDVPLARPCSAGEVLPLAAVYLLERSEALAVEPLTGVAAAEAVFDNTYRGAYVPLAGSSHEHWSAAMQLVRTTPVFRAGRRWGMDDAEEQNSALLEHALRVERDEA